MRYGPTIALGGRMVGAGYPALIIAEAGVNHNGDMGIAHRLIEAAAESGADAVKFQAFVTEELLSPDTPKALYQLDTTGAESSQHKMLKALELSPAQQRELKQACEEKGLVYLCTPYDVLSVDLLDEMAVEAIKVGSSDVTNTPILSYIASKGRPVILSTGWSNLADVEAGVCALREGGLQGRFALLQCTSEYPAPMDEVNLRVMATLEQAFDCPVGFSDHTYAVGAAPIAVAAGACIVEKHFTLDRDMDGPDHQASLLPQELADVVSQVRNVETALGTGIKSAMPSESPNKGRMQKSLVARRPIAVGELITADSLTCKRPGTGLTPDWMDRVTGRRASRQLQTDDVLDLAAVDWTQ
jgi:N,N'-diacetyllegionaminate synthase